MIYFRINLRHNGYRRQLISPPYTWDEMEVDDELPRKVIEKYNEMFPENKFNFGPRHKFQFWFGCLAKRYYRVFNSPVRIDDIQVNAPEVLQFMEYFIWGNRPYADKSMIVMRICSIFDPSIEEECRGRASFFHKRVTGDHRRFLISNKDYITNIPLSS